MHLNLRQQELIARVFELAQDCNDAAVLRAELGAPILDLLRADSYVSFDWIDTLGRYGNHVSHTTPLDVLRDYDRYYHTYDLVTRTLERFNRPCIAEREVGERQLRESVFYNEYLQRGERKYSGINLYFRDAAGNLGDFRVWRSFRRPPFDDSDIALLRFLQPMLTSALRRCRRNARSAIETARSNVGNPETSRPLPLSAREMEVARLAAQGMSDKRIARDLGISFTTVRTHLGRSYQKLSVSNRVELARELSASESTSSPASH